MTIGGFFKDSKEFLTIKKDLKWLIETLLCFPFDYKPEPLMSLGWFLRSKYSKICVPGRLVGKFKCVNPVEQSWTETLPNKSKPKQLNHRFFSSCSNLMPNVLSYCSQFVYFLFTFSCVHTVMPFVSHNLLLKSADTSYNIQLCSLLKLSVSNVFSVQKWKTVPDWSSFIGDF